MKLRRKESPPATRQRLRGDTQTRQQPVSKTFLYSSRRSEAALNTGRQLQRDLKESATRSFRFSLQRFGLVILAIAAIISLFNILKLSSDPKIEVISSGNSAPIQSTADYQKYAHQQLSKSFLNGNKVTVDTVKLSQEMLDHFPDLKDVSVTVPLLAHRPIVYIEPTSPSLVLVAANGTFLVSETGRAMSQAADVASLGQNDIPVITDQSGLNLELGKQALPGDSVSFIKSVLAQLSAAKVTVGALNLPSNSSELDVQIAGQPYFVKFNLHSDKAREQAGTYLATIASLQNQHITPAKYIDVRVSGRAYYQ